MISSALIFTMFFGLAVTAQAQDGPVPASPSTSAGAATDDSSKDLLSLDLNDLMKITVTSTSKSAQPFNKVAASMYVITAEDIRRSGAPNIPEALRLVPGVQVDQVDSGQYAVSIRGFNSVYSDKLLVLVDGRTIYNNLYGGVFWQDQKTPMEDIERIEVIRGPGTAIWGANAVQGIINIITKSTQDTQGLLATAEYGDGVNRNQETVRYGGKFGTDGSYRIFGMSTDLSDGINTDGSRSPDANIDSNGGFRLDKGTDATGKLQVSGDIFRNVFNTTGTVEDTTPPYFSSVPTTVADSGGDLLTHYEKLQSNGSTLSVQADYTKNLHFDFPVLRSNANTENIDVQDSLATHGAHSIIFGLGYRTTSTNVIGLDFLGTAPYNTTETSASGYVQDQISLSKTVTALVGSKFERDNYTGWEYEPSVHVGYSPDEQHTLWTSASRAVQIPSIGDIGLPKGLNVGGSLIPNTDTLITEIFKGKPGNDSTIVTAYEAGYRVQATSKVLFDFSGFYNQYSELMGIAGVGSPSPYAGPPAGLQVPLTVTNIGSGDEYGGEAVSHVKLTSDWRVNFGYSYLYAHVPVSQFQSQIVTTQADAL
jgi:iron complex outermembrane receptor protein